MMFVCFVNYSSVINLIYSRQRVFTINYSSKLPQGRLDFLSNSSHEFYLEICLNEAYRKGKVVLEKVGHLASVIVKRLFTYLASHSFNC
jgi:hypothetical protein